MSTVVTRIIGGLAMMVGSIILLILAIVMGIIEIILRTVEAVIMVAAMFVAGVATIFGIYKLVKLCENIMEKITDRIESEEEEEE